MNERKNEINLKKTSQMIANAWLPIVVSFLTVFVVTVLIGLMDFDFSALLTGKYWAETAVYIFAGTFIFSYSYFVFIRKIKTIKDTPYAVVASKHYEYQKIVRDNQLRESLIPKVKAENERRKRDKIAKLMGNFGFDYKDYEELIKADNLILAISKMADKKAFTGKKRKQFLKRVKAIVAGEFNYDAFTIDEILTDSGDRESEGDNSMSERSNYHSNVIIIKTITTVVVSSLLATLVLKSAFDKKWLEILIKGASIIISNAVSASMKAWNYITYRKSILENRNTFFASAIPADFLNSK